MRIGSASLFYTRDWYDEDIAALFSEADRYFEAGKGDEGDSYGYQTTARRMRERLQARGFSARKAWSGLASAVAKWAKEPGDGRRPGSVEDEFQRYARQLEDVELVSMKDFEAAHDQPFAFLARLDTRDVLRLLLDRVPGDTVVALDLSELTGCCVEMDPQQLVAEPARQEQLHHVALDSPLIVLTEGGTDSRLLSEGMKITHPHLSGFINFIDFDSFNAEGGVAMLPKIVYAFVASGVANRIAAIGDNDTEAHDALEKIKKDPNLPENVRILHYPDLPTLKNYPTLGPYSPDPVLTDINGRAGALEMYLGRDVLTIDGQLVPVQWRNINPKLGRYQGTLLDKDKKAVQKAFAEKVKQALARGGTTAEEDWSGIEAIIERLLTAFD
jgi:HEPN/Toprim N-terminal domain 1